MAITESRPAADAASELIDSVEGLEKSTFEAVRGFLDTLRAMFPDVRDDGPRQKVVDSAVTMVEQIVGASNQFARDVAATTRRAFEEFGKRSPNEQPVSPGPV